MSPVPDSHWARDVSDKFRKLYHLIKESCDITSDFICFHTSANFFFSFSPSCNLCYQYYKIIFFLCFCPPKRLQERRSYRLLHLLSGVGHTCSGKSFFFFLKACQSKFLLYENMTKNCGTVSAQHTWSALHTKPTPGTSGDESAPLRAFTSEWKYRTPTSHKDDIQLPTWMYNPCLWENLQRKERAYKLFSTVKKKKKVKESRIWGNISSFYFFFKQL